MNYTPIVNSKLNVFRKNYSLENLPENDLFEIFINNIKPTNQNHSLQLMICLIKYA